MPRIIPANPQTLANIFRPVGQESSKKGLVAQFLERGTPVHFGGMSDPFQPAERKYRITLHYLKTLSDCGHPVVISTKGDLLAEEPYLSVLRGGFPVVVQFSLVSTENRRSYRVEPHATPPTALLKTMEKLSRAGVTVTCRWQPFIEQIAEDPPTYVRRVAEAGARHLALEHLKMPVEPVQGRNNPVMVQARSKFREMGARRDGREFVLMPGDKLARIMIVRSLCHEAGMTFGAADNEFAYLSDGEACCSGVDQFPGFEHVFRYQISAAIKRSWPNKQITLDRISQEWRPMQSIDWCLNSRTRLSRHGEAGTLGEHVRRRWNEPSAPGSPLGYFGVVDTGKVTSHGDKIYGWLRGAFNNLL